MMPDINQSLKSSVGNFASEKSSGASVVNCKSGFIEFIASLQILAILSKKASK